MKGDLTPGGVPDYRQRLSRGEDAIDPEDWAGALSAAQGIAPRVRVGRDKWFNLLWLLPIGWMGPIVAVAAAGATATSAAIPSAAAQPAAEGGVSCYSMFPLGSAQSSALSGQDDSQYESKRRP